MHNINQMQQVLSSLSELIGDSETATIHLGKETVGAIRKALLKDVQEMTGGGFLSMPVRFFIYDEELENEDGESEPDIRECTEEEFIDSDYAISYERHTVYANGCKQICLTKCPTF